jgi:hypothetical protein
MKVQKLAVISAGATALLLSLPAVAAEKITGVGKDFQTLSELTAVVPDKPGHNFKQLTLMWKASANWGDSWISAVEQQDVKGTDIAVRGYGTDHYSNGDVDYFTWEGTGKVTPKDGGAFDLVAQGKFTWTGGTGKHNVTGPGTYACKFTQAGGTCDFQGDASNAAM